MTAADLLARVRIEQTRSTVNPLRACEVCDHGAHLTGRVPQPTHTCMLTSRPVPCAVARSNDGHCGPDARHQRIHGDDLLPTRPLHHAQADHRA